ncbi:hypothetical protein RUM43_005574 [Polyplax serrata]|uniref:Uncharacterized protein n=1 Tax=Polyplax serrata TaxID=468196 RepID=A0AAN8PBD8_POLSC
MWLIPFKRDPSFIILLVEAAKENVDRNRSFETAFRIGRKNKAKRFLWVREKSDRGGAPPPPPIPRQTRQRENKSDHQISDPQDGGREKGSSAKAELSCFPPLKGFDRIFGGNPSGGTQKAEQTEMKTHGQPVKNFDRSALP